MKAYTIHKFYICRQSGAVIVERSFAIGADLVAGLRPFSTVDIAESFVMKEKTDWFRQVIEKWVNHKKQIIDAYPDPEKVKALTVCLDAVKSYHEVYLKQSCRNFLKGISWFERILPNPNNTSYESSKEALNELKKFCEQEIK